MSGSAAMVFIAAASLSIIDRGVPAGTTKAAQDVTTKLFSPASAMVGTSGSVGQRCAEVTARARIFPDLMKDMYEARLSIAKVTSPDSMAGMVCAAPRNGTCTESSLVRLTNMTPDKCGDVPTPGLPKLVFPLSFAQAMNSVTVLAGT